MCQRSKQRGIKRWKLKTIKFIQISFLPTGSFKCRVIIKWIVRSFFVVVEEFYEEWVRVDLETLMFWGNFFKISIQHSFFIAIKNLAVSVSFLLGRTCKLRYATLPFIFQFANLKKFFNHIKLSSVQTNSKKHLKSTNNVTH